MTSVALIISFFQGAFRLKPSPLLELAFLDEVGAADHEYGRNYNTLTTSSGQAVQSLISPACGRGKK
jgi:hypothetical protein